MKNKTKAPSCGCSGVLDKKRKTIPLKPEQGDKKRKLPTATQQPNKKRKTVPKKTQLQLEREQRDKNRKLAKEMVKIAQAQWLQKFPPEQNVVSAPKHKGLFFPPKQDTERLINRQKVNQQVGKVKKEIQAQHKKTKTKWEKSPGGSWHKNQK